MPHLSTPGGNHARKSPATGAAAMKRLALMAVSVLFAVVAAVGVSVAEPDHAQAASGGYVKKCGGGKILLKGKEKETFALHNQVRKERNLKPFCVHPKLQKAARAHSKDMIRRDYFSHDTKGGGSFDKRLKRFGYTPKGYKFYMAGENIAYGSGSYGEPKSIMRAWMNSEAHRHNILKKGFREIGIGTYTGTYKGTRDVTMYTADFGVRRR